MKLKLTSSLKINDKDHVPKITQPHENTCIQTTFEMTLENCESYLIQTIVDKEYSLKFDRIIGIRKDYLIHNFNLRVFLKGNLRITFVDAGSYKGFKPAPSNAKNTAFKEFDHKGLLYPKQGYTLIIEKKA